LSKSDIVRKKFHGAETWEIFSKCLQPASAGCGRHKTKRIAEKIAYHLDTGNVLSQNHDAVRKANVTVTKPVD
jgi:hypothetical protein